jgi:hypothetical protein
VKEYQAKPFQQFATRQRPSIEKSTMVGCYYCCRIYPAVQIKDWTDGGQTAVCDCYVDSVLADADVAFDVDLLRRLHDHWFGD